MNIQTLKWGGILASVLLLAGIAGPGYASDQALDEELAVSVSKSKKNAKKKSDKRGFSAKVDTLRAEVGAFTGGAGAAGDAMLHVAASAKGQTGGQWEYALGLRFDGHAQTGGTDFSKGRVDYTENYVRWRAENTRMTVGTQNVLWGRVDEISPIDRLSRADLSRVILDKLPDRRRAVPAIRLEHFVEDFKIDAVWLPVFDAAVLPHQNSTWNPVDTVTGRLFGIGTVPAIIGAQVREDEHGNGGWGARVTRTGGNIDYGVSLQRARQSLPYYQVSPGVLTAVHPYTWVLGGELETQRAGATWRMEAAWSSDVPVTRSGTFLMAQEQALDVVFGSEFFPGDGETRVTVQLAGHKTFSESPILDREKFYALNGELEHGFAEGHWRANLRFSLGLDERDLYLNPKLTYLGWDQHELYLAAHIFSGAEQTLGGYYRKNDLLTVGWQAKF